MPLDMRSKQVSKPLSRTPEATLSYTGLQELASVGSPPTMDGLPPPGIRRRGLRVNFSWMFTSTLIYSIAQWCMMVILAKLGTPAMVGQWALAQAICAPVMLLPMLGLRGAMITDARNEYTYGQYIGLRLVTAVVTVIAICGISIGIWPDAVTAAIIVLTGVSLGIMSVREIVVGVMFKNECMDLAGRSQILLAILTLGGFSVGFALSRSVVVALCVLISVRLTVLFLYDVPVARRVSRTFHGEPTEASLRPDFSFHMLKRLCLTSLPLGLAMVVVALHNSIPVYFLEAYHGKEATGFYGSMALILQAAAVLVNTAGTAATPRLARYFVDNRPAFWRLMGKLMLLGLAAAAGAILFAALVGRPFLRLVFTRDYSLYAPEFVWMMVAAGLTFFASFATFGMVARRAFGRLLFSNLGVAAVGTILSYHLVPGGHVAGAALARAGIALAAAAFLSVAMVLPQGRPRGPSPATTPVSDEGDGASYGR